MATYFPIKLQPGVYKQGTDYQAKGRWLDADCIRWSMGATGPIGGWRTWGSPTDPIPSADGIPRTSIAWKDNDGDRWIGTGTYKALYVYDDNGVNYDITPTSPALTPGQEDADPNTGYGDWHYGRSTYGLARPDLGNPTAATIWSFAMWGEDLTGTTPADGRLWIWDTSGGTGTNAILVSNSPTKIIATTVTPQRIQMCFGGTTSGGTQNRREVFWSDIEDNTDWTPSATNQAGSQILTTNGDLLGSVIIRDQILLFTTTDAHIAQYVGQPYVYQFNRVGENCGPVSINAVAVANNTAYWMGNAGNGFFTYDGYVRSIPSDVEDYINTQMTEAQASKVIAWHNSLHSEIFWFYPASDSTEVSAYVSFNYEEQHWAIGTLARSGVTSRGVFERPICFDTSGNPYEQEIGGVYQDEGDSAIVPYAQSGPIEIGDGDRLVSATKYIPDITSTGDGTVIFSYQMYPTSTASTTASITLSEPTSIRFQGRQFTMKVSSASANAWNLGVPRIQMQATSRR